MLTNKQRQAITKQLLEIRRIQDPANRKIALYVFAKKCRMKPNHISSLLKNMEEIVAIEKKWGKPFDFSEKEIQEISENKTGNV